MTNVSEYDDIEKARNRTHKAKKGDEDSYDSFEKCAYDDDDRGGNDNIPDGEGHDVEMDDRKRG